MKPTVKNPTVLTANADPDDLMGPLNAKHGLQCSAPFWSAAIHLRFSCTAAQLVDKRRLAASKLTALNPPEPRTHATTFGMVALADWATIAAKR